ncbi:Plasmodium variant antigen protein Cir/Yir/Bir, putative, partial [Plasmodium chabaudi chabaudi]
MANKACSFLLEADEYFNNGIVDVDKFNKNTSLEYRCPYENRTLRPCQNNYERINALGAYLYQNLSTTSSSLNGTGHNNNRHVEFFLIWLGDKLFKIDNDYKITMGEYYEKNLKNSMGNFNYWNVLKSKAVYKDATIRRMNQMYSLLNNICKLITEYNKHNKNPKNISSSDRDILVNHSTQCRNFYGSIHKSVNECKPYLHLLDSLKKLYENFISARIIKNKSLDKTTRNSLSTRIKSLKTFGGEDKYFVSDSEVLSFDNEPCGKVKIEDEDLGKKIASNGLPSKPQGNGEPKGTITGNQRKQPGNPGGKPAPAKPVDPKLQNPKPAPAKPNPSRPQPATTKPVTTKPTAPAPAPAPAPASGPSRNVKQVSGDSPAKKPGSANLPIPPKKPVHTPPGPVQGQAQIPRKPDPAKPGAIIPGTPPPPQLGGTPSVQPAVPPPPVPPPAPPPAPPQGSQKLGAIPQSGAKGSDKGSDASKSDTKGSGIQKGNSDSGGGGKGALNADTGGTSGGSKNPGGKPIDDIQKKPGHVDTSPPVSQASSQGVGSGNQRGTGGTSPSSIDSGKGNTTDNTSTGDNGKKDSNGVTVNNKGDQLQGTDHAQGSSSSVTGGSAIGPGVGTGGAAGGSGGSGKTQGSLSSGSGNPGGDPGVTSSGASGGKVGGADSGATTGSVSAQSDQGVSPAGSVPPGNGQGDTNSMQGVGKTGKDTQVGDNSNIQGGVGVNKGGADANTGVPGAGKGGSPGGAGGSDSKLGSEKGGVNAGDSGGGTGSASSGSGSGTDGADGGLGTPNPVSPPGDPSGVSMNSGGGTKASGKSYSYWPNFWGTRFSPTKYLPSLSDMYETQKNILAKATNQVSDAYNKTMTIAQNAYGSTVDIARNAYGSAVTNIKSALTTSSNYIGNAVGSVTSKLNPFSSSSQPSGDQSGSNSLGGGVDTSDQSQQNPSLPPPSPPSQTLQPISPPKTPSDPPSAPSPKLLDPQPISTQIPKSSDQQSTPSTGKGVSQIPLSTKGTLPSSSISPSNTGNGNNPPGTDVKINEKPSIWCIAQNKKCDIVGIGIIGTSLFVFLAIMYKYISFGSAKNSKKEKNMKRVINLVGGKKRERTFINSGDDKKMMKIIINSDDKNKSIKQEIYSHDGKRKTHITINSGYKKKNTKSVINSDDRKTTKIIVNSVNEKIPLLNIYKLMQADPMPFINLF